MLDVLGERDYRMLTLLRGMVRAQIAREIAANAGWEIDWRDCGDFSMCVTVRDKAGVELARQECLKPSWWENDGERERRMAEAESEAVNEARRKGSDQ